MNSIQLLGRLTRDPELRHTQTGTPVASFALAVDDGKDANGNRKTQFFDIVAWRSTAEFVTKYFSKGQMIAVAGKLQNRDWTDKEGSKRRSTEVIADNFYFTGDNRGDGNGNRQQSAGFASDGYNGSSDDEDDLMF